MVPHSSHVIFNFNHSCFHVQGKRKRGIWTDFRLRFSALGLKWASSVSLQNGDMCLQSVTAARPAPHHRGGYIFMLSGSDCVDVTFTEEQFKILNKENVGLPKLSLTLSLKTKYWVHDFY